MNTAERIEEKLAALEPETVDIRGRFPQARRARRRERRRRARFSLIIVSRRFSGESVQRRHRMVYDALGSMMQVDIHALAITARAPEELERQRMRGYSLILEVDGYNNEKAINNRKCKSTGRRRPCSAAQPWRPMSEAQGVKVNGREIPQSRIDAMVKCAASSGPARFSGTA